MGLARRKRFVLIGGMFLMIGVFASAFAAVAQGAASFIYKALPQAYMPDAKALRPFQNEVNALRSQLFDLTGTLPKAYVTSGSVDYTRYLQRGLDAHRKVLLPNFPILVNSEGLKIHSNSTLVFQPNSKIIMAANDLPLYKVLKVEGVKNVTIYFPVIEGDRKNHKGTAGEWGMGIAINGSSDIRIVNPVVSGSWGDGIYIGRWGNNNSTDVTIYHAVLNNNRRNGISIISGERITLESPVIANTHGTAPMSAIDIEPNTVEDYLKDIVVRKPITFNNHSYGILISLFAYTKSNSINVSVDSHQDYGSQYGLALALGSKRNTGSIRITKPRFTDNTKDPLYLFNQITDGGIRVSLVDPRVSRKGKRLTRNASVKLLQNRWRYGSAMEIR